MKTLFTLFLSLFTLAPSASLYTDACTLDHKVVAVHLVINQDVMAAHKPLLNHLRDGFVLVASKMDAETFQSKVGYQAFMAVLDDFDRESLEHVYQPEVVEGSCK